MIVKINEDNSLDYNAWFSEITDAFKNSGDPAIENIVIDTLEAYYAHIEDIARNLGGKYLRMPVDEDFLLINNNTREISVSKTSFAKNGIAVEADHLAEIVYFKVDRYFDRMDLAQNKMNIEIRWSLLNAKRQMVNYGANKALFIDAESFPGEVVFGWAVTRDMCSEAGTLSFSVCFYIGEEKATEETGLRDYSLNTQIASLPVKAGIGINDVDKQINSYEDVYKALFNSVYTDKGITPLDQPIFSYLSWEDNELTNGYVYPFESTLVQYQVANLTTINDKDQWAEPVELYSSAYCPGATGMTYGASYIALNAGEKDKPVELEISPKYIEMSRKIAVENDLPINAIYGDTGAVYVKKNGDGWNETPMSLTEVKDYFANINQIKDNPDAEFAYGDVAKKYMAINADKVGIYRFSAEASKKVDVDGNEITVNSKKGQSSAVVIPPACDPIAKGLIITVEGKIEKNKIEIIDKDNQDYEYVSADKGKITKVRSDGLGILVGTHEIGTDNPKETSIVDGKKPVNDYKVFAGQFALVINDGKTDKELEKEEIDPENPTNLFLKIKNKTATDEDFAGLEFRSMEYINDEQFSGEYGIDFGNKPIPVAEKGVKIEGYAVHRKNGTYKVSQLLSADKIATPAAYSLQEEIDDASAIAVEYALETKDKGIFDEFKSVEVSSNQPEGIDGVVYNTASANKSQGIQLKATYAGDTNGEGFKLHWFYGSSPAEAESMKKEFVDGGNGGLIKVEQSGKKSVLIIDGAVDTGVVTYLVLYGENEFNNTISKLLFKKVIIAIGESGL